MGHVARLAVLVAVLAALAPSHAAEDPVTYVVLQAAGAGSGYHAAASALAKHHGTNHVISFDPDEPDAALEELRALEPTHVAIVLPPEAIHVNSVRRILRMATKVDDDPFVDFEYGYVTGATGKEAEAFVESIVKASRQELPRKVGRSGVWGGTGECSADDDTYEIGPLSFPSRSLRFRSPDEGHGRDQEFIDDELKSLQGCGAIIMGGHGMPWEIVSGPQVEDLKGIDLFPAVAFNYACYTGVTHLYPERSFGGPNVTNRLKEVDAKRSFALAVLRSGVVGYVAYVNPRPAGPEMTTEFQRVLTGWSLGAVRRRDYDKIVLGYLGYDEPGIVPPEVEDGGSTPRAEIDSVRHLMLDASTGGILFGDPAHAPFPKTGGVLPLRSAVRAKDDELHVTLTLRGKDAYLWGADPFRRYDESTRTMAMKVYDRVPVPDGFGPIRSVRVAKATWGGKEVDTLPVVWAEERDRGRRYLHVKANFARGGGGDVEVRLVAGPKEPPPEALHPRRPEPTSTEALVTRLNQSLLQGNRPDEEARKKLRAAGREAFDAVLTIVKQGRAHVLTHELLGATRVDGDEAVLMRLANGPDLPNYGTWTILQALGHFDTAEVRTWLLERLGSERGAGRYMSVAKALAMLREKRGTKPVAAQLLLFEKGWTGVEWQLVHALAQMGGAEAVPYLVAFVSDERATRGVGVSYALDHLERLDLEAAKETAKALAETARYAGFSDRAREHIGRLLD